MYGHRFAVEHSNKLFEVSSIYLDTFLTHVTRELVNLWSTAVLLMHLAVLSIRCISPSLAFILCGSRWWINLVNHTVWGLELIQRHNSNRLHMSEGSRCWMRWIWYRYIPSVCNVRQTLGIEVITSGLNSRANSESEISKCIRTHGSD
jgi:hypothetical protein